MDADYRRVAVVIIFVAIIGVAVYFAPLITGPQLDSSWLALYGNSLDRQPANWLNTAYGCQLGNYYEQAIINKINSWGLNLVVVGGWAGSKLGPASWFERLELSKPSTQPDAYFQLEGTAWVIHTPSGKTYNGDYALITRGFDIGLRRYVIFAVGVQYSGSCAAGKFLVNDFDQIKANSWVVIKVTAWGPGDQTTIPTSMSMVSYQIIEKG